MDNTNAAVPSVTGRRHVRPIAVTLLMMLAAAIPLAQGLDPAQPRVVGTPLAPHDVAGPT
jgi:hypothetical protein